MPSSRWSVFVELRQLKYFLGILKHGNFNRAADALFVTQPALSKSMRTLEEDLGVELLERTASGVIPTPYGRILANYATLACQELQRAIEEITALSTQGSGRIIVGASTAILRYLLPTTFEHLSELNANLEVVIREGLRDQLHMQLPIENQYALARWHRSHRRIRRHWLQSDAAATGFRNDHSCCQPFGGNTPTRCYVRNAGSA